MHQLKRAHLALVAFVTLLFDLHSETDDSAYLGAEYRQISLLSPVAKTSQHHRKWSSCQTNNTDSVHNCIARHIHTYQSNIEE